MNDKNRTGRSMALGLLLLTFFPQPALSAEKAARGSRPEIRLETVAEGLEQPVGLVHAGDGSRRLFIIEQVGVIRILKKDQVLQKPFLNIRKRVASGGEKGLLGLAFHPDFAKNHRLFVNYTEATPEGLFGGLQTVIAEYRADPEEGFVNPKTERRLLTIRQPFSNHNGGQIAFGPDGMLYIGMGDGGAGNDPEGHAQNLRSRLGKLLRIDVNRKEGGRPYGIPKDNPFRTQRGIAPEIWAYGLRNPWRFSFDFKSGTLYLADVGQNRREEIDLVQKGGNYGWNVMEGKICTPMLRPSCNQSRYAAPLFDYPRTEGTVVIGGYRYRGRSISALKGAYIYGDFGNGHIWMLRHKGMEVTQQGLLLETGRMISAFGEDKAGELYVVDYAGKVLKIAPKN